MTARRQLIAALSEDSMGGIATLSDVDHAEQLVDAHRTEVLAEVTTWLIKKAREFHVSSRKREREQGDTCAVLASKIARGAVRPDNLRMLPEPGFFEVDRTYRRASHGQFLYFRVDYVGTAPNGSGRTAFGWLQTERGGTTWTPWNEDDFTGWTDVTGEVAS